MSKHTIDRRTFFALTTQATKFEYTPREIVPQAGEPVVLELKVLDFVHGFSVPDLKPRAGHEEMNGKFIVKAWTEAPCVC